MAFKEVVSLEAETTIAIGGVDKKTKKTNPTGAEGYYLGKRVVKGNKYGDSTIHFLQTAKGNLGVWGKTNLNNKLGSVEPGTMIRITYAGLKSTNNGDMHSYKVELDETNTIDVSGLSGKATEAFDSNEAESDYNDSDAPSYDDQDEEVVEASVRTATIAGKTPKERQAEVNALLKSRSK